MSRLIRLRVRLIWPEVAAIQVCVLVAAVARGLDYLVPPVPSSEMLSTIEHTAPLWMWGWAFVFGGLVGIGGLVWNRWPLAALGHGVLLTAYSAFALGGFIDAISRTGWEGWRTPVDWACVFAVVHWGFADASIDVWREGRARNAN